MATTLDVVSFNVFIGIRSRAAPARTRAVEFCRRLTDLDVDFLLLQEVWTRSLLRFIGARLPSMRHVAWKPGLAGQPAGGLAVFSRRPLRAPTYTSFASARPGDGNLAFRGKSAVSCRMQGILAVRTADGELLLGNTQLTANHDGDWSQGNRHYGIHRQQVGIVRRAMRAHTAPLSVLGGDFNIASSSPLYPFIVDGWHDPFARTDQPTYRAEFLPAGRPAHRIDYLLVSGQPVASADLILAEPVELANGTSFLSDHLALRIRAGQ
ncbi:endonuclease/exonuclease/phosphatase family protein [Kibdelosporangium philippinense]|uniref:Endonuclease/exonuclease/phosphatase family protein n=1 Tax=Kibdelosporangium philippinense TaxID=211113 RepID=A0ABS8Z3G0_9PSEU|nr:endonuclease/exonuclease/phosphatase family protein [Kibdelosporangium philippinense]MCE7002340.1 endonuclease/exonuclease/phosphatase family protein [Kibdelosporangium philippinense]